MGAIAFRRASEQPDSREPFVQRDCGILEDAPDLDRKLLAARFGLAAPDRPRSDEPYFLRSAAFTRAGYAIRPAAFGQIIAADFRVREISNRFNQCSWRLHT